MKLELTQVEMREAVEHWLNTVRLSLGYPVTVKLVTASTQQHPPVFDVETDVKEKETDKPVMGAGG